MYGDSLLSVLHQDFEACRWTYELTGFWALSSTTGKFIVVVGSKMFPFLHECAKLKNCVLYKLDYPSCEFWWDRTS